MKIAPEYSILPLKDKIDCEIGMCRTRARGNIKGRTQNDADVTQFAKHFIVCRCIRSFMRPGYD